MKEIRMPNEKYAYFYSGYDKPVAEVDVKEEVAVYTLDAFNGLVKTPKDTVSTLSCQLFNPLTGPIVIKGAEKGDTLKVTIKSIENTSGVAVGACMNTIGGINATDVTRMINDPITEKVWIYDYKDGEFTSRENPKLKFKEQPFSGSLGTAPENEVISSTVPSTFGGNMDVKDMCPGNTLYFPVNVDGAYFYIGDAHGKQGDGELNGTGLEMAAKFVLEFDLIKGKKIEWPRIENDEYIMTVGSARPLEDAARIAWCELVEWIVEEYGWDKLDAYELLSKCGEMYLGNMVDPNYSMVAMVKKEYL